MTNIMSIAFSGKSAELYPHAPVENSVEVVEVLIIQGFTEMDKTG